MTDCREKMNKDVIARIHKQQREAALRGEPRMQSIPMSSAISNHRTGPPPISPNKRKYNGDQGEDDVDCDNEHVSKMSRLFAAQLGCVSATASNYRRPSNTNTACDPVIEEHFRRSLGKNYKEPEPVTNSVSITGSVDDHFAKALGETWLQIKAAKDVS
ncbi:UNVERIFIED_CONTAM: hypothetical protein FKN15_002951 [Acipenser sinensis]